MMHIVHICFLHVDLHKDKEEVKILSTQLHYLIMSHSFPLCYCHHAFKDA